MAQARRLQLRRHLQNQDIDQLIHQLFDLLIRLLARQNKNRS